MSIRGFVHRIVGRCFSIGNSFSHQFNGTDYISLVIVEFDDLVIESENFGTTIRLNDEINGNLEIVLPGVDAANITAEDFLV